MRLLILNLGSTSSKVAVFEDEEELFAKTIDHDPEVLKSFKLPVDQFDYRKDAVFAEVKAAGFELDKFDAVCSRAGLLRPTPSGTYTINERTIEDAKDIEVGGRQPHGLGLRIADALAKEYGVPAYFCDPVSTDELADVARVTGLKGMVRKSQFHALNQKAVARMAADAIGKPYEELNLIGVHLGGGTSVAAHCKGQCIDISDCSEDDSFSMDRAGGLPVTQVVDLCFSGQTKNDIKLMLKRGAGVVSYLGTTDMREVMKRVNEGDKEAELVYNAFIYQHSKAIGAHAAAMHFDVDGIFFTGGMAHDKIMMADFEKYVGKLAPIYIFPGEKEMLSLAKGALRVLRGEEEPKEYK